MSIDFLGDHQPHIDTVAPKHGVALLCLPPSGALIAAPPGEDNVDEHEDTEFESSTAVLAQPWTPRLRIQ